MSRPSKVGYPLGPAAVGGPDGPLQSQKYPSSKAFMYAIDMDMDINYGV